MWEQGQILLEDFTEKEEILSSKSDPKPDLDDNEDFPYSKLQRQLKPPKKRVENPKTDTIVHEHITRSGHITSFKLPHRL